MIFSSRTLRVACVAVLATSLAACGGHSKKKVASPTPSSTVPTTTAAPSTTPPPPGLKVNPFTGLKPSNNRVAAVKIDDTANGRPPVNLDKADIVYIEEVEGGLTRLLAVYNTQLPTVEPVRSTRASDPELMAQYGPIAYVASGGAPNPLQVLDRSNLRSVINDRGGAGFSRDYNRPAPYNLSSDLSAAATAVKGAGAKDVGFTWAPYFSSLSRYPSGQVVNTVVGGTGINFQYDKALKRYVRLIGGTPLQTAAGKVVSTPNVVVQFCQVTAYPQDVDVVGNISQYTHTIGKGKVVVFRDGRRIQGIWSRPTAASGTTLTTPAGSPIPLELGGTWVVLVATGAPLS